MKSGEFAEFCGTTKNTLIHYDQLGLLTPSSVGANGYRYYAYADAMRFVAISAFRDAGFSLKQIKRILDDPDPVALADVARKNNEALRERIRELRRSSALLEEIASQADEAQATEGVRVVEEPERLLLAMGPMAAIRPGDDLAFLWDGFAQAMDVLALMDARAQLSPYGFTAEQEGEGPVYRKAYFLLPDGTAISEGAAKLIGEAEGVSLEPMPAGKYVVNGYFGPWEAIAEAYEAILEYASASGLALDGPFFETSALRLLDDSEGRGYRCNVSIRLR